MRFACGQSGSLRDAVIVGKQRVAALGGRAKLQALLLAGEAGGKAGILGKAATAAAAQGLSVGAARRQRRAELVKVVAPPAQHVAVSAQRTGEVGSRHQRATGAKAAASARAQ